MKGVVSKLQKGLTAIMPSCREVSRLQSDTMEAALPFSKRLAMRFHLLVCTWCRRYGRQIRFLRSAVQARPDGLTNSAPQSLSPEARERLKKVLHETSE